MDETLEKIAEAGSRAAAMGLNDEDSEESDSDDDDDDDGSAKRKSKQYHSSGSDDDDDGDYGTMVNLPKKAVHDSEEEVDDDEEEDDDDDDEGYGTMVQRPKKASIKTPAKQATIEDSDTDGEDSGTTKFTDPKAPSSAASSGADPLEISDVLFLSFSFFLFVRFLITHKIAMQFSKYSLDELHQFKRQLLLEKAKKVEEIRNKYRKMMLPVD